jgi:Zn-dependent oligopeptidase
LSESIWKEARKQHTERIDSLVKDGIKEAMDKEVKRLNTLGLSIYSTPALLGFCTGCEANKAELKAFKEKYNHLDGVIQQSAGCYKCSEERTSHQESRTKADEEFTKLNNRIEALLQDGRAVVAERDQLLTEKNGAFSMLAEQFSTLDTLKKQNF